MLERAKALQAEMVRLRRDIHQHPELSFQEVRTARRWLPTPWPRSACPTSKPAWVARAWSPRSGRGAAPPSASADMDALPIHEQVDVPSNPPADGVMHACGHDSHTAMLLAWRTCWPRATPRKRGVKGNVRLLFQPAEEAFDADGISSATAMIQDGALAGVDKVIALHVISTSEACKLYFHDGPSLAAVDSFEAWCAATAGMAPTRTKAATRSTSSARSCRIYGILAPHRPAGAVRHQPGRDSRRSAPNVIPTEIYVQGTIRQPFARRTRTAVGRVGKLLQAGRKPRRQL